MAARAAVAGVASVDSTAVRIEALTPAAARAAEPALIAILKDARRLGRTTLVLDTREGDPSEALYAGVGWVRAGVIPRFAESAGGGLDGTALYYKLLAPNGGPA